MFETRQQRLDYETLLKAIDDSPEIPPCTNWPDLFFPGHGEVVEWNLIRETCAGCPIVAACASYGIKWAEHGVWGGMTQGERREIRDLRKKRVA